MNDKNKTLQQRPYYLRFLGSETKGNFSGGKGELFDVKRGELVLLLEDEVLRLLDDARGWPDQWEVPNSVSDDENKEVWENYKTRVDNRLRGSYQAQLDSEKLQRIRTRIARQLPEEELTDGLTDTQALSHEIAARDKTIIGLRTTVKALRLRSEKPSREDIRTLLDEQGHRFSSGKVNFTALGKTLGVTGDTAKRWIEKYGLSGYALGDRD